MRDPASSLVRKLWQYCNVLRDDGLSYPDYVEQLTYLLFLKMSDEQGNGPVPAKFGWRSLVNLDAEKMHRHYSAVLSALGCHGGTLGLIFRNAKNKIRDPAKLRLLIVDLIGQTEWSGLSADLKGDAYEGLLEKNARDTKSGAGQYFTPRPLIEAIVRCVDPQPGEVICDPACGTAGFLLAAHDYVLSQNPRLSAARRLHLQTKAIRGVELVEEVARLATMNLLLHGVSGQSDDELPIVCSDSLKDPPKRKVDVVLTNPPFGVKGSVTYAGADRRARRIADELTIVRPDFRVQTANKQLNFLQHVISLLKPGGRAAAVIPDNVLFESGPAAAIRRRLLETCDVHTLLRLPTGLFYASGVKANVLFFDLTKAKVKRTLWVYDLRSASRFSLKTRPLKSEDLLEFVELYRPGNRTARRERKGVERWRRFDVASILATIDARLDVAWAETPTPSEGSSLSRLDELSDQIARDLERALNRIRRVGPSRW
ncbi:MAG: SAM-dependent DNA methyltransferase [Proteobacteria bacterium]|nr:SAM-dependent DNA methyltransferase [Pseudomonadota bacterium]